MELEKVKGELQQAKLTIADLYLQRQEHQRRISALEEEARDLRCQLQSFKQAATTSTSASDALGTNSHRCTPDLASSTPNSNCMKPPPIYSPHTDDDVLPPSVSRAAQDTSPADPTDNVAVDGVSVVVDQNIPTRITEYNPYNERWEENMSGMSSAGSNSPSLGARQLVERSRKELPATPHEHSFRDSLRLVPGRHLFGNAASTIQAAVLPTHQRKIQQLKDELHKTNEQLAEARSCLEPYARELRRTRAEIRQMTHDIKDLEQRLKETSRSSENDLSIVRGELRDAKNLALIRDKNLLGLEAFLTKVDALSISEVIEKVADLNEEIFQSAALLGEALIHQPQDVSQEEMNLALGIARRTVGARVINILREQPRKGVPGANPFFAQVVLQIFLVTYCSQLVQSWSKDTTCATFLATIYSKIRDEEEQAVAGRWRALTRSHTRPSSDGWKEVLLRKLGCVLRVASWSTPNVKQREVFEQRLEPIFRAVEDLRNALGEKYISADLEVSVMEPDQIFQPAYMDDAYRDPGRKHSSQEVVVGTTSIGLKKVTTKRSSKGELMYKLVLSPKVALESTLLEALRPSPQGPRKPRE